MHMQARLFRSVTTFSTMSVLAGTLAGALALVGCHSEDPHAAAPEAAMPAAAVVAVPAVAGSVPVYLDEIGRTSAREAVMIVPQVSGKIVSMSFVDGTDVKQGDLLFTIDQRPYKATLASAQAALAESRAKLKFAQDEVKRMEEIKGTGAVSITEFEQKVNTVDVSAAQVQASEAAVETAQLNLDYCEIRSPIAGRTGQRMVDPGNVVTGGGTDAGTKLLTVQRLDPIYADFTVTENELGTVRKFMAAGVLKRQDPQNNLKVFLEFPGDASNIVGALSGSPATTAPATQPAQDGATTPSTRPAVGPREGRLTFLDNAVQDGTGTVRVRATVPNSDRYFWPGQFVNVRLVLAEKPDAVLVPTSAIQIGQQGSFVYVVKPDSTAEMRPVATGQRQGDLVVLNSGVKAGEQVVTKGQMLLSPGAKVMVANPPAAAPTSQAVAEGSH